MSRALGLLIALALTGCAKDRVVYQPHEVEADRLIYVPIPARLTPQHPIAEGPLSQCPAVAAARKAEIEKCNAENTETAAIQGTRVDPKQ